MNEKQFTPTSFTLTRAALLAELGLPVFFNVVGWQVGHTLELSVYQNNDPSTGTIWDGKRDSAGVFSGTFTGSPPSAALGELVGYIAAVRAHLKAHGITSPPASSCACSFTPALRPSKR